MMNKIYKTFALGMGMLAVSSCDDYLDKLPDDRAELDTEQKVTQLLVSAYPSVNNHVMMELSSVSRVPLVPKMRVRRPPPSLKAVIMLVFSTAFVGC